MSLLATFWLASMPAAVAGVADAPGEQLEISLITYGPGAIYWERFGHNAIEIRDPASEQAASFNYGVFDFDERGFLLNFARGHMHYMIDVAPSDADRKVYADEGRSITRQRLALTATQAAQLRDFLLWNLQPDHLRYDYDYLVDNCSTRVRDAIDRVLDGRLRPQLTAHPGTMTYRGQIDRLMSAQPWLMLAMDFGLGPFADRPLNAWQESFLPVILQQELRAVRIDDGPGSSRPLVIAEGLLVPNTLIPPPSSAPDLRLPLGLVGFAIAALIVWTRSRAPTVSASLAILYVFVAGIAGLFLLGLWTLTLHRAAWANMNLLLCSPVVFVLLRPIWRGRHGIVPSRSIRRVMVFQLAAAAIAVLLHALPAQTQQNQPWLLFTLPIWSALAWMVLSRSQSGTTASRRSRGRVPTQQPQTAAA